MSQNRLKIGKQLQKSVFPFSTVLTDVNNEQYYVQPGTNGQIYTIVNGVPTWVDGGVDTDTDTSIEFQKVLPTGEWLWNVIDVLTGNVISTFTTPEIKTATIVSSDDTVDVAISGTEYDLSVTHTLNPNGSVTLNDGTVIPAETITNIEQIVLEGNPIANYTNEEGAVVPIIESATSFAAITNGYQFVSEDGTVYPFTFVFDNSTPSAPQLLVQLNGVTQSAIPLNSYDVNINTTGGFVLNPLTDEITITETDGETHTINLSYLKTSLTSTDGSVELTPSINPDGSANYDLTVGVPNAHIVATTAYDALNPLLGWTAPNNPIEGNTVDVKFTDGTVANYTYDGTAWVVNFVEKTLAQHDLRVLPNGTIERGSDSATDAKSAQFVHNSYSHLNGFSDNWVGARGETMPTFRLANDGKTSMGWDMSTSLSGFNEMFYFNPQNNSTYIGTPIDIANITSQAPYSVALGGYSAKPFGFGSLVGAGFGNETGGTGAVALSGQQNKALGNYSTVLNGEYNLASGHFSLIGTGGYNNTIGSNTVIIGGFSNNAIGFSSFIGTATNSTISASGGFIGGGNGHLISNGGGFIGSGSTNTVSGYFGFIGSGEGNLVSGFASAISSGFFSTASGNYSYTASGVGLHSYSAAQHTLGIYNVTPIGMDAVNRTVDGHLFVVGNGGGTQTNSSSSRSNALTILTSGATQINHNIDAINFGKTQEQITPASALEVVSITSGVLIPRLTAAEVATWQSLFNLTTDVTGLGGAGNEHHSRQGEMVYNLATSQNTQARWNGAAWIFASW